MVEADWQLCFLYHTMRAQFFLKPGPTCMELRDMYVFARLYVYMHVCCLAYLCMHVHPRAQV